MLSSSSNSAVGAMDGLANWDDSSKVVTAAEKRGLDACATCYTCSGCIVENVVKFKSQAVTRNIIEVCRDVTMVE